MLLLYGRHIVLLQTHDEDGAIGKIQIYTKGSLIRVLDFPPNSQGHNHSTHWVNYGIVIHGEMELLLEDGSRTVVYAGDVVVQQAVSKISPFSKTSHLLFPSSQPDRIFSLLTLHFIDNASMEQ